MAATQKITPHLWFDKEAVEATRFYASVFRHSRVKSTTTLRGTPSGTVDLVDVDIDGQPFAAISAGPFFKINASISFLVPCDTPKEVDRLWKLLSDKGTVRMPLGSYPFSERYGWVEDRYGVSWQVMHRGDLGPRRITPTLMFTDKVCGKAEEAVRFYASVFRDARVGDIMRYKEGEGPDKAGTVKHAALTLEGQDFAAMDSARVHDAPFNEAISFVVHCETQAEIDHYWEKLSADKKAEQCGWLKDRYGVSWQIVPTVLGTLMQDKDPRKVERVTKAFLAMKKFDIKALMNAAENA